MKKNKTNYLFISLVALGFSILPNTVKASPANTSFKDDNFYSCVLKEANLSEGTNITKEQLEAITILECDSKEITDVSGIELMTSLKELSLNNNEITNIDLSNNKSLNILYLEQNKITNVDLSKNINLEQLYLANNEVSEIDLSKNINLNTLDLTDNKITCIDLSKNIILESDFIYLDSNVTVGTNCKVEQEEDNKKEENKKEDNKEENKPEITDKEENKTEIIDKEEKIEEIEKTEETTNIENPKTGIFKIIYIIPVGVIGVGIYLIIRRKNFY